MNLKELKNKSCQEIADMAIVGHFKRGMMFEVKVWTKDGGEEPHIHIVDENSGGQNFSACVKLLAPEYFPHGNKYKDVFNSQQKKAFVEFMASKDSDSEELGVDKTVYEVCCWLWNKNNSNRKVKIPRDDEGNALIPDYSLL